MPGSALTGSLHAFSLFCRSCERCAKTRVSVVAKQRPCLWLPPKAFHPNLGTGPLPETAMGFLLFGRSATSLSRRSSMNTEAVLQPGTTETKAQKAERLKREKNPWECLEEIRAFARQGHGAIPEDWLKTYFKWWGVYTQGDGAGVTGASGPTGKTTQYFITPDCLSTMIPRSSQL